MALKIDARTPFADAFKQCPTLVWSVAQALLAKQSHSERFALLDGMVTAAARSHQHDQLLALLQMLRTLGEETCEAIYASRTDFQYKYERDRAAEREAVVRFRQYLAKLFWLLPDTRREQLYAKDQDGSRYEDGHATLQALPEVKRFIFQELLPEWTAEPTEQSVHAFRRAIAMGWPLSAQLTQKFDGEHDVEVEARGRHVGQEERKPYVTAIRIHLENFGSFEEKQKGADAVFGPWLAQKCVPEDIEKLLVIARAKMGAAALARRDIRFAGVLNGLPESGIALMQGVGDQMRSWLADAAAVVDAVVIAQRARHPHWRGTSVPHAVTCTSLNGISIEFTRCHDADDQARTFSDASIAMAAAKKSGWFRGCTVTLAVRRNEDESDVLTHTWHF